MARLTLVVGGMRSGKSRLAEELAAACPPVTYLATAQAGDAEMAQRIARHRQRRSPQWRTVEEPWHVVRAVASLAAEDATGYGVSGCVLLECLTLWLTNLLLGLPGHQALDDVDILSQVKALAEAVDRGARPVIVVSNEVGSGIIPADPLARRFADLLGEANQGLAASAAEVYHCVAGIAVRIK